MVFVGARDHAATALYAGLITKEAAKVAEGFIGGQFTAATAGDQPSREVFGRYAGHVGTGLATMLTAFRPAPVVIAGSAAQYLPLPRPGIDRALNRVQPYAWRPPIVAAELGEYAGAIGAAVLPWVTGPGPRPAARVSS